MSIVLHHLNQSRSQRILFLLEEMGVPYELRHYQRDPKTMLAPQSLRAVHPLGKSPVLTDEGTVYAETGVIIDHLTQHYADQRFIPPADTPDRRDYTYYLHYAEGSLMPLLLMSIVTGVMKQRAPWIAKPLARAFDAGIHKGFLGAQLKLHLGVLERSMAGRTWFAGPDLSGADAMMSFPLQVVRARYGLDRHPALRNWLDRLEARPAWSRAVAKGGPMTFDF